MTDFETMKRVQWDGFPGEKVAQKVVSISEESERRIANLLTPELNKAYAVAKYALALVVLAVLVRAVCK